MKNKCFVCGHDVECTGTAMRAEFDLPVDIDADDKSTVFYYTCGYCGCEYEIYEPTDEDKSMFEFWDKEL